MDNIRIFGAIGYWQSKIAMRKMPCRFVYIIYIYIYEWISWIITQITDVHKTCNWKGRYSFSGCLSAKSWETTQNLRCIEAYRQMDKLPSLSGVGFAPWEWSGIWDFHDFHDASCKFLSWFESDMGRPRGYSCQSCILMFSAATPTFFLKERRSDHSFVFQTCNLLTHRIHGTGIYI